MVQPATEDKTYSIESKDALKPQKLIAYCSKDKKNEITIFDMESGENYAQFQGAAQQGFWNYVRYIPNTRLLCSLHQSRLSAQLKIFDVSSRNVKERFSTEAIQGRTGLGIIAYNSKRGLLAIAPVAGSISYHLITLNPDDFLSRGSINLARKTQWHSQFPTDERNAVTDLDINKGGNRVAMIDRHGTCLIADVDTNKYITHLESNNNDNISENNCRWISDASESQLFVTSGLGSTLLNIYDVEKEITALKSPIELFRKSTDYIDVCPSNNNLLATAGTYGASRSIKIYDRRQEKIIKNIYLPIEEFSKIQHFSCVRWSLNGDQLIAAPTGAQLKVVDYTSGNVIPWKEPNTIGWKEVNSACFI